MKDTTRIGDIAHSAIVFGLMRSGFNVLEPVNDGLSYDLVIEKHGKFERVQCKSAVFKNGAVEFKNYTVKRGGVNVGYGNSIEYFGVYCNEIDKTYLVPIADCNAKTTRLRVNPAKNNEKSRTRWAEKYEL